jgi:RNA-directed DNA polymerase
MMRATESQGNVDTALTEIAYLSSQNRGQVFHSLIHHINEESLERCFKKLDGKKAVGVDKVSKIEYEEKLASNLKDLIARMKRGSYRPQPVRQVLIPKEGKAGATRPLGISSFEDKLVQRRVQEILESIYEPLFKDWSYGFRPSRGCHDAIEALHKHLYAEEVEMVIDVDLANFFGTIDHEILKGLLCEKIKDTKFIQLICRMLKSGVLAEGEFHITDEGVPQGSCCSPTLSNLVAHYVIDEWLEETVKPLMRGTVASFRYADDLVICCRYEEDAQRIRRVLGKRLEKYKLKLNEEKTKMVRFSKSKQRLGEKQEVFDFLGFTFYLGKSKRGATLPKLKTCGKRYRSKLNKVRDWARKTRNSAPLKTIWKSFCSKLRGHVQYYGVSFNHKAVAKFLREAEKILFKWLNRRSQRKSFDWGKFNLFKKKHPTPEAKIQHKLF